MHKFYYKLLLYCYLSMIHAIAFANHTNIDIAKTTSNIRGILENIFVDNAKYVKTSADAEIRQIYTNQSPRATVLTCSDSRLQSIRFDDTPINDLFFVRNIGNQIKTLEGSVEYGVTELGTPVLLIIGHTDCGAIKAALSGHKIEHDAIRRELDNLHITQHSSLHDATVENVHNQVDSAITKFSKKIKEHTLIIIGAIYDFQNMYKRGYNRLILINLNGERNPEIIRKNPYLKGIDDVIIGVK